MRSSLHSLLVPAMAALAPLSAAAADASAFVASVNHGAASAARASAAHRHQRRRPPSGWSLPRPMRPPGGGGDDDGPLRYDDDDFFGDEDAAEIARLTRSRDRDDLSGAQARQFSLGYDLLLDSYVGSMGFDEVVDWEYYYEDDDGDGGGDGGRRRTVVQPPPFDPSKPKRTRSSSGSVVRVFRGELGGRLGATLRSRGLDRRVLVKEFSDDFGAELARAEVRSIGRMQSTLCAGRDDGARRGEWASSAATRYLSARTDGSTLEDDACIVKLMKALGVGGPAEDAAPYTGILGGLSLRDFEDDDEISPQEWYSALKVAPPKPGSVWIVYEYAGLTTLAAYAQPAAVRVQSLPPRRGPFGNVVPAPPLPPWRERANYVVRGVLQKTLQAVATLHEAGIAHRSIGRSSILLSSVGQDKMEASSPYALVPSRLVVKLADLGFSGPMSESSMDEGFRSRARAFGIDVKEGSSPASATNFAMAEDLHALGFVFLGVLLTTLADIPSPTYTIPATDEDSLQRLLAEIFEKDIEEFREYCEAEDIWSNLVDLLDENDGAGWDLLSALCFARERAAEKEGFALLTARELLANPLFTGRR